MKFNWINTVNAGLVVLMLLPHLIAKIRKNQPDLTCKSVALNYFAGIGAVGSFLFMIMPFMLPSSEFGFQSDTAFAVWLIVTAVLMIMYWGFWIHFWVKGFTKYSVLAIGVIPAFITFDTGIRLMHPLLTVFSLVYLAFRLWVLSEDLDGK